MQDLVKNTYKTYAFGILCGANDKGQNLKLLLDRISKLRLEDTGIDEIITYVLAVGENSDYIKTATFRKYISELDTNLKVQVVLGNSINTTEARAYNHLLNAILAGHADYFTLLHDTDMVMNLDLIKYQMWLFKSAHNPNVVGAAALSNHIFMRKEAPNIVKMWYVDDVMVRGTCIKREAALSNGPFDEYFIYRMFEHDYFSRLVHHMGYLTRVGKEENTFIKLGPKNLTQNHKKLNFIEKPCTVWFSRKWQYKGYWVEETKDGKLRHYETKHNNKTFNYYGDPNQGTVLTDKFSNHKDGIEATKERLLVLYSDDAIKKAIECSQSFVKKPHGTFVMNENVYLIHNSDDFLTTMDCKLKYHDNLLWKAKEVF